MAKNLVIVESPAKARTVGRFLGKDYDVKASMGHVRDLPRKKLGVDIGENGFIPTYTVASDKRKIVDFTSGLMVVNLGHNNKYIQEGFHKHINTGIGYTYPFFGLEEREQLSDRLLNITVLNDGTVFYTNGGSYSSE